MPVHTLSLTERILDRATGGASRWPKLTPEEAAELRAKGCRFSIYRPEEDGFRLRLPLQTIKDRVHGTLTIEQGEARYTYRQTIRVISGCVRQPNPVNLGHEIYYRQNRRTEMLRNELDAAQRSVKTDTLQISISELLSMYESGEIFIHPEFQRLFRWTRKQKSDLVESLLVGIPIPSLFVYETPDIDWELVDGLQRVSTILEFMGALRDPDQPTVKLPPSYLGEGTYLKGLHNCVWEKNSQIEGLPLDEQIELDKALQMLIRRSRLTFQVLKQPSDPNTKFDLFRRLNRGGVYANEQEVRSCLMVMINSAYFGSIREASRHPSFLALTNFSDAAIADQTNIEHVVRYLVHANYDYDNESDVQDFVDKTVIKLMAEKAADEVIGNFKSAMDLIFDAAGQNGLRSNFGAGAGSRYTLRSLEAIAVGIGRNLQKIRALPEAKAFVRERIEAFWRQPDVDAMSASGLRGTQRLQRTIPFGSRWFDPDEQ